jgi:hypothetical protein
MARHVEVYVGGKKYAAALNTTALRVLEEVHGINPTEVANATGRVSFLGRFFHALLEGGRVAARANGISDAENARRRLDLEDAEALVDEIMGAGGVVNTDAFGAVSIADFFAKVSEMSAFRYVRDKEAEDSGGADGGNAATGAAGV